MHLSIEFSFAVLNCKNKAQDHLKRNMRFLIDRNNTTIIYNFNIIIYYLMSVQNVLLGTNKVRLIDDNIWETTVKNIIFLFLS